MIWGLVGFTDDNDDDDDDDGTYIDPEAANQAEIWDRDNGTRQDSTHTGLDEEDGDALSDNAGGLFDWIYKL